MEIGPISEDDLPALAALYQQLKSNDPSVEKMRQALQIIQSNPNQLILGAKIDGQLVGSVLGVACQMLFGQCKSFMLVEDVVVDVEQRRAGVGTALMLEIERFAATRNCSYIILLTEADRVGAQRFYLSLGYQTDPYKGFMKVLSSNSRVDAGSATIAVQLLPTMIPVRKSK